MKRAQRGVWIALALAGTLVPAAADSTSAKLAPAGGGPNELLGVQCDVDGDTAVVANSPWFEAASVTVFSRSGGTWSVQQTIGPGPGVASTGPGVALQGDTLAIGGTADASEGAAGPAVHVFVRSGTTWTRQASVRPSDTAASFTTAVALDGDTLVVGDEMNDGAGSVCGAVYVFTRTGTTWSQQAKLVASDGATDDRFGCDVALSGDTLLVGALGDDDVKNASGAAYVFVRSGTAWTEQQKLIPYTVRLYDQAGTTVALDGDTAVVGSEFNDDSGRSSGTVWVYGRGGGWWNERAQFTAPDAHDLVFFGSALDLEGDRLLVGALGHDAVGAYGGRAYLYEFDPMLGRWMLLETLNSPEAAAGDQFGYAAAMSGSTIVVGAPWDDSPGEDSGSAWAFEVVPPVVATTAALVPTSVVVVLPTTKAPAGRAPGLYAKGLLDTGSGEVNLRNGGDLVVGTRPFAVSGLTPGANGRTFTFDDGTVRYVVTAPADGCSRATFDLAIVTDLSGVVDPEGALTLAWYGSDVRAESTIDLTGGKFRLTSSPDTLDPGTMLCLGATARCLGAGRDSFSATLRWGGTGEVPAAAPEVEFAFGDVFGATLDPAKWTLRKGVWRYSDPKAEGVVLATIDFVRSRAVFRARKCSVGEFAEGPVPLTISLDAGDVKRSVSVRARMRKKTLHY